MTEQKNQKVIFNLKDEIAKVAPAIDHAWSTGSGCGIGTENKWGHVKVQSNISNNNTSDTDCANIGAIKEYMLLSINTRINDDDIDEYDKYSFVLYDDEDNTIGNGEVQENGAKLFNCVPLKVLSDESGTFQEDEILYIINEDDVNINVDEKYTIHKNQEQPLYIKLSEDDEDSIYNYTLYDDDQTDEIGSGTIEVIEADVDNNLIPIVILTNNIDENYIDSIFYVDSDALNDDVNSYHLYKPTPITKKIQLSYKETLDNKLFFSKKKVASEIKNIKYMISQINFDKDKRDLNSRIDSETNNLQSQINNSHPFNNPHKTEQPINQLKQPGYYYYKDYEENTSITYGDNTYYCGVVIVKKINNNIIQYIDTCDSNGVADGNTYKRLYNGNEWGEVQVVHRNIEEQSFETLSGDGHIHISENTAGYIITWVQDDADKKFIIANDHERYEYKPILRFNSSLVIDENHTYIFGNLIGKMDVKITSNDIQVRSTLSPGDYITNVHETYFIPRSR